MKRKVRLLLVNTLLFIFVSTLQASESGYVFGDNHCFYFDAPDGWNSDHISGVNQGLGFVFYPANSTWANATTVAYVKVANKTKEINTPLDQVKRTISQFKSGYASPNIRAHKIGDIRSASGAKGEIYRFEGDKWGNAELVAYFTGKDTFNFFVLSSRDAQDLERNIEAFKTLARSYREAEDCIPCTTEINNECSLAEVDDSDILELDERNRVNVESSEGREYEMKAIQAFWGSPHFMSTCVPRNAPLPKSHTIYFEVNPDGKMQRLVINPITQVANCIAKNVYNRQLPKPPSDFVVKIELNFTE